MGYGTDAAIAPEPVTNAFGDAPIGLDQPHPEIAKDIGDNILAGLQASSGGLAVRGEMPDIQPSQDATWYERAAYGLGSLVGDVPAIAAGAAVGGRLGGVPGSMAGSFAIPMALREALTTAYTHNYATTWEGVQEVGKAALEGGAKGAAIGLATFGAGRFTGPLAEKAFAGAAPMVAKAGTGTTKFTAELGAMTTTGAALEGQMPTWQDFMDGAVLLGGVKGVMHATGNMMRNFTETGKTPAEQVQDAMNDPVLREQILKGTKDGDVPEAYKQLAVEERVNAALGGDEAKLAQHAFDILQDPTKPLKADPVRYEYVTDSETAQAVIQATAEAYSKQVEVQRRGRVSTAQSFADAQKLVEAGLVKPRKVGEVESEAMIAARATLTKGAAERAQRIADELSQKNEAELSSADKMRLYGAMEQVGLFYSELAGSGAEVGRAMRMLREIKRDPGQLGDAEVMLKQYAKRGSIQNVTELARSLKDPAQMANFVEGFHKATKWEKVTEVWKAAILSGFKTPIANVLGNVGRLGVEQITAPVEASVEAVRRVAMGDPVSGAVFKAKALAPVMGLKMAVHDGMKLMSELQSMYREAAKSGDPKRMEEAKALIKKMWQTEETKLDKYEVFQQANTGKVGMFTKVVFDIMLIGDVPFRTVGQRAKAYELAVERAVNEKYAPGTREFEGAVKRYVDEPTAGLKEEQAAAVTAEITHAGSEYVFAEPLGPRMADISKAIQGSPAEFVFPFRRTPINIMSWAMQHMPGLNLVSARWRSDFEAGGKRRDHALARIVVGTALAGIGYELAANGAITGGGLFGSSNENRTKRASGWQPYSIVVDGNYYSFQRLEPAARIFSLAADIHEMMNEAESEEDKQNLGAMLVLLFGNATISTTYMSGIANAMNALADPDRYGGTFVEQYAASLVPKAIGQTVVANDPYKREVDGALEAIQSQLPFIREKLLPVRDVWGEKVKNENLFTVLPVAVSRKEKGTQEQKVKDEAARLSVGIMGVKDAILERGPFKASVRKVELTGKQKDIWRETRGKQAMEWLRPIVNDPSWESIADSQRVAIFREVVQDAGKVATNEAIPATDPRRVMKREDLLRMLEEDIQRSKQ